MSLIRLEVSDEFERYFSAIEMAEKLMGEARELGLIVTKCEVAEEVGHL